MGTTGEHAERMHASVRAWQGMHGGVPDSGDARRGSGINSGQAGVRPAQREIMYGHMTRAEGQHAAHCHVRITETPLGER